MCMPHRLYSYLDQKLWLVKASDKSLLSLLSLPDSLAMGGNCMHAKWVCASNVSGRASESRTPSKCTWRDGHLHVQWEEVFAKIVVTQNWKITDEQEVKGIPSLRGKSWNPPYQSGTDCAPADSIRLVFASRLLEWCRIHLKNHRGRIKKGTC